LGQRNFEDAESVRLADGQVDGEGGRRYEPATIAGRRNGTVAVQKREKGHGLGSLEASLSRAAYWTTRVLNEILCWQNVRRGDASRNRVTIPKSAARCKLVLPQRE